MQTRTPNSHTATVSVITTAYQENPHYFRQCIDSILNQTFENFEFIIVLEPDDKEAIVFVRSFCDRRLQLIVNEKKMGFVASLNQGIKRASGKYIARIDSDDYSAPDRLKKQVTFMEANLGCAVLGGNLQLIGEDGKFHLIRRYPPDFLKIRQRMALSNGLAHPSVMMRRSIIDEVGLYNETFPFCEDLELWLRMINVGHEFRNLETILTYYRVPEKFIRNRKKRHWHSNVRARWMHLSFKTLSLQYLLTMVWVIMLLALPESAIGALYQNRTFKRLRGIKN
jgi:glycosyltransferase EpsE